MMGDAVALFCTIDVAGGQEVRHLTVSKKGRLKWKVSGTPMGFRVVSSDSGREMVKSDGSICLLLHI